MKVLVGLDGTPAAVVARQFVGAILWPRGSLITLLRVQPQLTTVVELPASTLVAYEHTLDLEIEADLGSEARELEAPGREVLVRSAHGRPATTIVDEAVRSRPDLVVVGSRGRGTFRTMLLGSVAAEVVDQAPCPVLVARTPRLARIVLADDGSQDADRAAEIVTTWPIFQGLSVRVVSVAPVLGVLTMAGPVKHEPASEEVARTVDRVRQAHQRIALERAAGLTAAGIHARDETRTGDPAEEIVRVAGESEADLIVMGSRGRTGLTRALLGSVARNVLLHAPCSVLITRGPRPTNG